MASGKNPDPSPMRDATLNDSLHNHGFEQTSAMNGQKIIEPYGLDRSTEAGTAIDERGTGRTMGGGTDNLSHSLRGVKANMTGRSKG